MKTIALLSFVIIFSGCAKNEWNKDDLTNGCLKDFYKRNEEQKLMETNQIPYLCDCMTDKLLAKYKSEKESSRDEAGVTAIGRDCAMEVLSK